MNNVGKKFAQSSLIFLLLSLLLMWIGFYLFGRAVIEALYFKQVPGLFGDIIQGQSVRSLDYYFDFAIYAISKASIYISVFCILCFFIGVLVWRKIYRTALFMGSMIVVLLVGEIVLRLFSGEKVSVYQKHSVYHHGFIPNAMGIRRTPEWKVVYKINGLGYRDDEISNETRNIIAFGDSFTEGFGSEHHEIFTEVAETILRQREDPIRIINAGCNSYSPILEYLLLKNITEVQRVNYEAVILFLDLSDIQNDYKYEEIAEFDSQGNLLSVPPKKFFINRYAEAEQLTERSKKPRENNFEWSDILHDFGSWKIVQLVRDAFESLKPLEERHPYFIPEEDWGDIRYDNYGHLREGANWDQHFQRTANYLEMIHRYLQDRQIPFYLVLYPYAWNIDGEENGKGRELFGFKKGKIFEASFFSFFEEFAKRREIPCLNALPHFRREKQRYPEVKLFYDLDIHFSKDGNRLLGEALADFLSPYLFGKME